MKTYVVYSDVWDVQIEQRELLVERLRRLLTWDRHPRGSTHRTIQCRRWRYDDRRNGDHISRVCSQVLLVHVWINERKFRAVTYFSLRLGWHQGRRSYIWHQLCNDWRALVCQTVDRDRVTWQRICVAARINGVTAYLKTAQNITVCTVMQDCCKGRSNKYRKWHFWGSCRPETP